MAASINLFNKSCPDADKNPEVRMVFLLDADPVVLHRRPAYCTCGGRPPAWYALAGEIKRTLQMVETEHTAFAPLFALFGASLAAQGLPGPVSKGGILMAMVGVRSAARAFSRMADNPLDSLNAHRAERSLSKEKVKPSDPGRAVTAIMAAGGWICVLISGIASTELLRFKAR